MEIRCRSRIAPRLLRTEPATCSERVLVSGMSRAQAFPTDTSGSPSAVALAGAVSRAESQSGSPGICGGAILYCNPVSARLRGWMCQVGRPLPTELLALVARAIAAGKDVQQDIELANGPGWLGLNRFRKNAVPPSIASTLPIAIVPRSPCAGVNSFTRAGTKRQQRHHPLEERRHDHIFQ